MSELSPLRFDLEVPADGRIEVNLPGLAGSHVTIYVAGHPAEPFDDLAAAASSSTDFWENDYDDEDWNEA